MTQLAEVAWVRPPEPIRGLDHIGVQAPCTALYTQLLPGLTNVTERARYYTFYPWLIRSFERRYQDHSLDEFRRVLRRAECLFALIAIRHSRALQDGDEGRHGAAMVGRQKLLRIEDGAIILLDEYADIGASKQYFQNKLGGLGQYYFGPLRDLRILDHSSQGVGYPPGYDRDRGKALADALGAGVPEDEFFAAVDADFVDSDALDRLAPFCPCALSSNKGEHEILLDLFLARTPALRADRGEVRRASLAVMLDLAGRGSTLENYSFEDHFRGASYTQTLLDGSPWKVHATLLRAQSGWGTYQRNELLSVAVQGLFAAVLAAIDRDRGGVIQAASEAADVGESLVGSLGRRLDLPLEKAIADVKATLPTLDDWTNSDHELQRAWHVLQSGTDHDTLEEVAEASVEILLALLARGTSDQPYADFELEPEYFDPREIHLLSFLHASRGEWRSMTLREWVRWLSVHWCVGRHLRVALRKLRAERRDTFRIRPLDGELRVVEVPAPTFTLPRVRAATQILRDLALIEVVEGESTLTDLGARALEACHGK